MLRDPKQVFSDNLLLCLKKQKLSQAELARKMGKPRSTINRWVRGESLPSPEDLQALATVLAIPYGVLFLEKDTYLDMLRILADLIEFQPD